MVIRVKLYNEESGEQHEVTTSGDFFEFYLKVLNLVKQEIKNERKAQEIRLSTGRIRTLLYTNPEVESRSSFGFDFIFNLIEKEIYENRVTLNKKEKSKIRTTINRLANNKNDRLERVGEGLFKLLPEKDFLYPTSEELVKSDK
jgi:hypothetical protein